jgi:hypothetical protein
MRGATMLLAEPFAETAFDLFLRESAIRVGVFESAAHFVQNVEMVLDVLD